jgi:hypothetical protein
VTFTQTVADRDDLSFEPRRRFVGWPLWAVPAGVFGLLATMFFNQRPEAELDHPGYTVTPSDTADLDPGTAHLALVFGYLAVACLLVLAAQWRRRVEARFDWSAGAPVVTFGLVASAATLSLAYGWMGALSRYLPGGAEDSSYDEQGRFVYFMLSDFSPYIGWLGVLVAAGAIAWMAWRERLVSRVLGSLAGAFFVGVLGVTLVSGIPGLPGIAALSLVLAGAWLSVGNSVITRSANG